MDSASYGTKISREFKTEYPMNHTILYLFIPMHNILIVDIRKYKYSIFCRYTKVHIFI